MTASATATATPTFRATGTSTPTRGPTGAPPDPARSAPARPAPSRHQGSDTRTTTAPIDGPRGRPWLGRAVAHLAVRLGGRTLLLIFPELLVGALLLSATRQRVRGEHPERGDAIQWVIVTAIGAAIAVTVGTIIFNKLQSKATNIDVTTPPAR